MQKRGQLTLFVILSIVVVAASIIGYSIIKGIDVETPESSEGVVVYAYVDDCIEKATKPSVYNFGLQQGYHVVPEGSLDTGDSQIAYFYYLGNNLIPENGVFEDEMSKIVKEEILLSCIDFSQFEKEGISVSFESPEVETKISENEVEFNVNFPITLYLGDETKDRFSNFDYIIPFRIGHIIDVSRILVDEIVKNPNSLDLTLFLNQDVEISVLDYDECNQVYILEDEKSKYSDADEPYLFSFAVLFNGEDCSEI